MAKKYSCFVISPIGEDGTETYELYQQSKICYGILMETKEREWAERGIALIDKALTIIETDWLYFNLATNYWELGLMVNDIDVIERAREAISKCISLDDRDDKSNKNHYELLHVKSMHTSRIPVWTKCWSSTKSWIPMAPRTCGQNCNAKCILSESSVFTSYQSFLLYVSYGRIFFFARRLREQKKTPLLPKSLKERGAAVGNVTVQSREPADRANL